MALRHVSIVVKDIFVRNFYYLNSVVFMLRPEKIYRPSLNDRPNDTDVLEGLLQSLKIYFFKNKPNVFFHIWILISAFTPRIQHKQKYDKNGFVKVWIRWGKILKINDNRRSWEFKILN